MKIQIIFLIVCVVASYALPERNRSANSELSGQVEQQQEHENTSQGSAIVDNELIDSQEENVDETTISSNETVAEGHKCNNWKWRRHDRRYWLRKDKEIRDMNSSDDLNDGERRRTSKCQESHTLLPQSERTGSEGSHHRHSHRHNHRNRTNTPAPPPLTNTTTSSGPLAEPFQE